MKNFPTICIDNFYSDPDIIRDFALKQEFHKSLTGGWPGTRTYPIHQLDQDFFKYFTSKFLAVFYDFKQEDEILKSIEFFSSGRNYSEEGIKTVNYLHIK